MHGFLLLDKPEGITSADAVRVVKRFVKPSKVGHSGTLDPAASGLLLILIGAATKTLDYLQESPKEYKLTVLLGEETDTCDREGAVVRSADPSAIALEAIEGVLVNYRGVIDQVPPNYSAIKKDGVPLYKLARKGVYPEVPKRKIEIFSLEITHWQPPFLNLDMSCSRGAYARSVARDIGRDLNVGGRLEKLRRIGSGKFNVADSVSVEEIREGGVEFISEHLVSVVEGLAHVPTVEVLVFELQKLAQGASIIVPNSRISKDVGRFYKVVSRAGDLVILIAPEQKGSDIHLRPVRMLNLAD